MARATLEFTKTDTRFDLNAFARAEVRVSEDGVFLSGTKGDTDGYKINTRAGRKTSTVTLNTTVVDALGNVTEATPVRFELTMSRDADGKSYRLVPAREHQVPHAIIRPRKG